MVVHVLHPVDALRGGGRFEVLRVAGHGAVQRHIPVYVPDGDICVVDEGVVVEFSLDRLADVRGLAHVRDPFHARCDGRPAALPVSASGPVPAVKAIAALVTLARAIGRLTAASRPPHGGSQLMRIARGNTTTDAIPFSNGAARSELEPAVR